LVHRSCPQREIGTDPTTPFQVYKGFLASRAPTPCSFDAGFEAGNESVNDMKLLLTSDLFDINDGGPLPKVFARMLGETQGWRRDAIAVWLRDGRSGWPDAYARFVEVDKPGMERMTALGVTRHIGLWINRDNSPEPHMILEDDMVGNVSGIADMEQVKAVIGNATVLVVPGGEPFKLMESLRSPLGRQVWVAALGKLRTGELMYVSRSAGTIIAGGNLDITGFRSGSTLQKAKLHLGDPINWAGLGLIPGNVALRPHYKPGGKLGAEARTPENRGAWSDDDFMEHVQATHPGITPLAIPDGDFVALSHGEMTLGRDMPYLHPLGT